MTRIGSLCTGYGGLDMAAQQVLGGRVEWVADPDPGAAASRDGRHARRTVPARQQRGPDAAVSGRAAAPDADRDPLRHQPEPEPRRSGTAEPGQLGPATTDPESLRLRHTGPASVGRLPAAALGGDSPATGWGPYGPAITRWERVLGRSAPHPVGPTATGRTGLAPVFVEWVMGLPAGHVTAVPGLTRNQMLKLLGNGVVPQQGAYAVGLLLDRMEHTA